MKKLFLLLMFPVVAVAEVDPTFKYLQEEPATLFDVSMLRLQHFTDYWQQQMVANYWYASKAETGPGGNVNSYYVPEDNRIYVSLSVMDTSSSEEQMEEGCQFALSHIRIYLRKSIHELFRHADDRGFELSQELNGLQDLIEMRCYVSGRSSSEGRFWARQLLSEEQETIGPWPVD